jgi:hypothetical protein
VFRHPVAAGVLALLAFLWLNLGWPGMTAIAGCAVLVLVIWRCCWPSVFGQVVGTPARCAWRAWAYRARLARGDEHRRPGSVVPGPDRRAGAGECYR